MKVTDSNRVEEIMKELKLLTYVNQFRKFFFFTENEKLKSF
jgi:hypothetical protein